MRVVEQVTGLQYDPDSPDSSPNDGLYSMESERKDSKDSIIFIPITIIAV